QSPDMEWARKGCRWAKACGLLHSAFGVRLAHVLAESTPEQRAALLVGIVVGADAAESVRTGAVEPAAPIWIAGASPLREVYRLAISENLSDDSKVRCVDDAVARIAPALG